MPKLVYLCHLWFGTYTELYLTEYPKLCYIEGAQQVHVEKYHPSDAWEKQRLSAICGWSYVRCPVKRS